MTSAAKLHNKKPAINLYQHMKRSVRSCDFEKKVRLAKVVAPMLSDQSSNQAHIDTIFSNEDIEEKVIAIIMLGFPKNRSMLPILQYILNGKSDALKLAAIVAICQMRDGINDQTINDILLFAYEHETNQEIKANLKRILQ